MVFLGVIYWVLSDEAKWSGQDVRKGKLSKGNWHYLFLINDNFDMQPGFNTITSSALKVKHIDSIMKMNLFIQIFCFLMDILFNNVEHK